MVVRLPYGGATGTGQRLLGGGPYHSQCPEMWFLRTPGWKIVAPASPADAKGLMLAAIRDENPVLYLEAKGLYGFFRTDLREEVPLGAEHEVEIGRARVRREGEHLTVLTYGTMVFVCEAAARKLNLDAEIIDVRTMSPLDIDPICSSVKKTGRCVVAHEATRFCGFGAELSASIQEECFWYLEAPIQRVAGWDTPYPHAFEWEYFPGQARVALALRAAMGEE